MKSLYRFRLLRKVQLELVEVIEVNGWPDARLTHATKALLADGSAQWSNQPVMLDLRVLEYLSKLGPIDHYTLHYCVDIIWGCCVKDASSKRT